jgi:signal transduction histidine kinase
VGYLETDPLLQARGGTADATLPATAAEALLDAAREIALAREILEVTAVVRRHARALTGADGVTFVLRDGDSVHYVDEDAIEPLWKGRRFPAEACISGWAMLHRQVVVIDDIYADDRIPQDAYRPTFVKSLAMVPVRPEDPVAAIGAYWARRHRASPRELRILETLAGLSAVAIANLTLYAELRRGIALREEFLGVASHELRSPLAGLRLQIGHLLRRIDAGKMAAAPRESIARIDRTAGRIAAMVDKLLDVSRMLESHIAVEPVHVDLAEVVRSAVDALPRDEAALVRLELSPAFGRWDRRRVLQIAENLLANAVKFGCEKPVHVRVAASDGFAVLAVRDAGIGIACEDRARIFERFERAVSVRHYGGFGVGLWLVRRNAEAHGGTVEVESAPGDGATFTVRLPTA